MPKKPTTTKEAIIEGAFRLIQERGHDYLTVRNLAAFLGCSTQPIMYQFPSLDTLKELIYRKADAFHNEYILAGGDLLEIGLRYIRFAEEEPQLFRFLFQSGRFSGFSMEELIRAPETEGILSVVICCTYTNRTNCVGIRFIVFTLCMFAIIGCSCFPTFCMRTNLCGRR